MPAPLELARTHLAAARLAARRGATAAAHAWFDRTRAGYAAIGLPLRAEGVERERRALTR